jgi:histidinol-phosphate aminotransferase
VIALRTLSKAYGLAGLRVGFLAASPTVCRMLDRLREPFNLSRAATAAGPAAVTDFEWLHHCQRLNAEGRDFLTAAFARLGFDVVPSQSNFILVDVKQDARALFERLMAAGIIVRPADGWGFDHHIRVTVGTKQQNEVLIAALEDVVAGREVVRR